MFDDWYVETVTVEPLSSRDAEWGGATYGAPQSVACMVSQESHLVREANGTEVTSGTQIHSDLAAGAYLRPEARVTLAATVYRASTVTRVITVKVNAVGDPDLDGLTAFCDEEAPVGDVDVSSFVAGLDRAAAQSKQGGVHGLHDWANMLLQKARAQVPIEDGSLSASGQVGMDADSMTAAVGFGSGGTRRYAVIQHEKTNYKHDAGRKDHYLSDPAKQSASEGAELVADAIRSALS